MAADLGRAVSRHLVLTDSERAIGEAFGSTFEAAGLDRYDERRLRALLAATVHSEDADPVLAGPEGQKAVIVTGGVHRGVIRSLQRPVWDHPILEACAGLQLRAHDGFNGRCELDEAVIYRLSRPRVLLVALYHGENFPLPRFALAIADLASALRSAYVGSATLLDMQLGTSVSDIIGHVRWDRPDILGVSVTFGQHDILADLMSRVSRLEESPLVVIGGSLAALNHEFILDRWPASVVARGFGETTIVDIARAWHSQISWESVNDIAYRVEPYTGEDLCPGDPRPPGVYHSPRRQSELPVTVSPELDLLPGTLAEGGVMQLEVSRGCSFMCSFCPREHKGRWKGGEVDALTAILPRVDEVYQAYPATARKLFLIDEEFMGYGAGSLRRANALASAIASHAFRFECMTRADQVSKPARSREWHVERIEFWRGLVDVALDRVLVGVESGADSVLKRFNKKISAEQNTSAIRTLTACGVPVRLTYITFDPLMSMEELVQTFLYQGRRDLLLDGLSSTPAEAVFEIVNDDEASASVALGLPMYLEIPYMLVSLEALIGSPYLALAEAQSLAGPVNLLMGRREVEYIDPEIGHLRAACQQWIDRSFALDYCLKSLMKLRTATDRAPIARVRAAIKEAGYGLLGQMLFICTGDDELIPGESPLLLPELSPLRAEWVMGSDADRSTVLGGLMQQNFDSLVGRFDSLVQNVADSLKEGERRLLDDVVHDWHEQSDWLEINALKDEYVG